MSYLNQYNYLIKQMDRVAEDLSEALLWNHGEPSRPVVTRAYDAVEAALTAFRADLEALDQIEQPNERKEN